MLTAGFMTLVMLSACQQKKQSDNQAKFFPLEEQSIGEPRQNQDTDPSDLRQPDVKVYVRRGQTLAMQTDGLILTAIDAAVQHDAVYSVTSLTTEELPPLPQGMMNMTEATAGYRLLPGGEHFSPYAELRIAYDPKRLPQGYTPDDIYTSFYDTSSLAWVRLERVEVVSPMDGLTMIQPPTTTTTSADSSGASIPMPARQRSRMTPQATS